MRTRTNQIKMPKAKLSLMALFSLLFLDGMAQETYSMKGTIVDSTGKLLEMGSVILLSPEDSTVIKGTQFWDGKFELYGIEQTVVLLKVTSYLQKTHFDLITIVPDESGMMDIGTITLKPDILDIEGVDVVYRIPMFKREVGKLIVNVEGTILSEKGTVIDVLKSSPNVIVKSDGEVLVVGKGAAILYLDGQRVNSLDMLSAISARDVYQINIIENPSAKYDAEGNAVVEIITRRGARNGYQASLYVQEMKRTNFLTMYGGNLNFRKDWFSAYIAGAHQIGTYHYEDEITREISGAIPTEMENTILEDERHKFDAGVLVKTDYRLDSINTLFLNYNGIIHDYNTNSTNVNNITENSVYAGRINSVTAASPQSRMNSLTGGYNRVLDTLGSNLKISGQYTKFVFGNLAEIDQTTNFGSIVESQFRNNSFNNIQVMTGQIDYGKNISEKINLDFGLKNSFVTNESGIDFKYLENQNWLSDSTLYNQFDYKENIAAVFGEMSGKISKFAYNVGLRYELTDTKGNSFVGGDNVIDRNYGYVFPNIQMTYDLIPDLVLGASYVTRINRPNFQDLDPFINFVDSLSSIRGNPNLLPSLTHSVEASLVYFEYASLKFNYSKSFNPIVLTVEQNPGTNTFSAITRNIESSELFNIGIVIPYEFPWWTTFNTFGYTWNKYAFSNNAVPVVNNEPSLYVNFYNEFRIEKLFNIEITYEWVSPGAQGIFIMRPYQSLGGSITRKFMKDKLTVRLSAFDVAFKEIETGYSTLGNFYVDYTSRQDTRNFQLSLTYSFGKLKNQTLEGGSIDSDEQDRIKK